VNVSRDQPQAPLFDWVDGRPRYRNLPVEQSTITLAGRTFDVASLLDAADLLDEPDFAERFIEKDRAPYGLQLWPAAIMLARHVLRSEPGASKRAIEIGAGLALVSIAASTHGWRVTTTDCDPIALRFARYNAARNDAAIETYEILDWHDPPAGRRFDQVWAADVLYQLADQAPLLRCLESVLAPGGTAMVADPNRSVADRFDELGKDHGFEVDLIPSEAPNHLGKLVAGRIFRLRRA
jgi:predicted nicotinamide N-methyase